VDIDPAAVRDFQKLAGVSATVLDLFDREQYRDFQGTEPPSAWREATPDDLRRAAGNERPHIVFMSPPCKVLFRAACGRKEQITEIPGVEPAGTARDLVDAGGVER
jgi:hypothetical protein